MTEQELQALRNRGNEAEAAANEIETLRQQVKELEESLESAYSAGEIAAELAALKQQGEPVAWMYTFKDPIAARNVPAQTYCKVQGPDSFEVRNTNFLPLYTSAPTIPAGYVLVPDELLVRVSASLGAFTSDEGWRQVDMNNMDSLDAYIATAPKPKEVTK